MDTKEIQLENVGGKVHGWNRYVAELPDEKHVWIYQWALGWRVTIYYSEGFYEVADVKDLENEREAVEMANQILRFLYPQEGLQVIL